MHELEILKSESEAEDNVCASSRLTALCDGKLVEKLINDRLERVRILPVPKDRYQISIVY